MKNPIKHIGYSIYKKRFEKKINKTESCWVWIGATMKKSQKRGSFWFNGKLVAAHRVAYILYKGYINDGLFVCHSCDNTICVNPDHLFLGTHQDNVDDKVKKNRQAKGEAFVFTKLDSTQVKVIRQCIKEGVTQRKLANYFKIDRTNISRIALRKSWKHI